MKLFSYGKDGGQESTVWGFWLVEIKRLFSVALLCFEDGSREAYHEHAFNSVSWVLKGKLFEQRLLGYDKVDRTIRTSVEEHTPSLLPIFTARRNMHKVHSKGRTWVLTFRGPWADRWREWLPKQERYQTLTHGRKVVA